MAFRKFQFASSLIAIATAQIPMKILYEADCPFCKGFIANDLAPHTEQNDPGCLAQVQIDWIPYGNAATSGDGVSCQHGEDECFGNRLHLCAKREFGGDKMKMTNWVGCVMGNLNIPGKNSRDRDTYEPCDAGIAETITNCANGDESLTMLREAGDQTQAIRPAQVPWVIFEESPAYNSQMTFIQDVCNQMRDKNLGQPQCCANAMPQMDPAAMAGGGYGAYGRRLLV